MVTYIQERDIDNKEPKEFVIFDNNTIFIERIYGRIPIISKIKWKPNITKSTIVTISSF